MKHLLILRHGKSDRDASYGDDHERPLNKRGRKAAQLMGSYLSRIDLEPDLVLTSSAVRARTTAELAREAGGWSCPQDVRPELYGAAPADVVRCLSTQDDRFGRPLVVGHEPTLSDLVSQMIGGGDIRLPTAALACIELDLDAWHELDFGCGVLQWLVIPRTLSAFLEA